jgi:hypothetical protein
MIPCLRFSVLLSSHRWTHPTIYDRDWGVQVLWILCDRHSEPDSPCVESFLCLFARMPARDNVAAPLEGTASPADDNSGVSNHSRIVGRHRHWLLTAYPRGLTRVIQPRWLLTAYPRGLNRVSQPPDPRIAWGQTPQFRQWSWADDSQPEGLCPTVLSPLDTPILS